MNKTINSNMTDAFNKAEKIRRQYEKLQYKRFDEGFIANLESFIPSLDKITRELRSAIKYEAEILPVEQTRRTSPESIRHLMQNTRYIREVSEDGIIPDRVLNYLSEIEYGIYENRFIMTLINRLDHFLSSRFETIKDNMFGYREMSFNLNDEFKINQQDISLKVDVKVSEEMDLTEIDEHNARVLKRLEESYKRVSRMKYSNFMKIMGKYKPVQAPIIKTQIILKNPDFRNAYLLWLYLDRLHALEFTIKSNKHEKEFSGQYQKEIDKSLLLIFSTIFKNSGLSKNYLSNDTTKLNSIQSIKEKIDYTSNVDITIPIQELEPQYASEYYLEKLIPTFDRQYKKLVNKHSHKKAIRQIILNQYGIGDQVLNHYLDKKLDEDVFDMLINYNDPIRKYEESFHKYNVAKANRQVKERLIFRSLAIEEKWQSIIEDLQKASLDNLKKISLNSVNNYTLNLEEEIEEDLYLYKKELKEISRKTQLDKKSKHNQEIRILKREFEKEMNNIRKQ